MRDSKRWTFGLLRITAAVALTTAATGGPALAAELPRSMVWSSYDLGSSGHTEASGIANALQTRYDMRIRIVPSGLRAGRSWLSARRPCRLAASSSVMTTLMMSPFRSIDAAV